MNDFKKHDIVWYYHEKDKVWKRGKIVNVNRYTLHIKDGCKTIEIPSSLPVVDGALPKPDHEPYGYSHPLWVYSHSRYGTKEVAAKGKLFKKLGIIGG